MCAVDPEGNAHPHGLTEILVNALDRGMNPQQAVDHRLDGVALGF
ncbi:MULTISPECIES: gamma-glutamyltransferase family protein [Synechococcales]|nr:MULTISPECIES: gamma-glutamyltransferase family protein [Synechococcales]